VCKPQHGDLTFIFATDHFWRISLPEALSRARGGALLFKMA
jgi:hypothetical protein